MGKQNHVVELFGVLEDGTPAKTHQADDVVAFVNMEKGIKVVFRCNRAYLSTSKGLYTLMKSVTGEPNKYTGKCLGIVTHITHKKIVGKLIYWA